MLLDLAPPAAPPDAKSYALAEPTEHDARAALAEVVGAADADACWARARAAAGHPTGPLSLDALWRVAQALAADGGMIAVTARSLGIRIRSFVLLQQRQCQS